MIKTIIEKILNFFTLIKTRQNVLQVRTRALPDLGEQCSDATRARGAAKYEEGVQRHLFALARERGDIEQIQVVRKGKCLFRFCAALPE